MNDYLVRLVKENEQLMEKYRKLKLFIDSELFRTLDYDEQALMRMQLNAMDIYGYVLAKRLEIHKNKGEID